MGKNPAWYKASPKWAQEAVDQTGHLAIGFSCGLTSAYLYAWWRENIKQWPPGKPIYLDDDGYAFFADEKQGDWKEYFPADRVWDKSIDELFYHIGFTVGSLTLVGLLIYGGFKWW